MWDLENQHQWKKNGAIKTTWELENKVPSCKNITDSLAFRASCSVTIHPPQVGVF